MRQWVHELKFAECPVAARTLAELLLLTLAPGYSRAALPEVIVPMPMTWRRLARRGHNHALTLARPIAKSLARPLPKLALRRIKHGPPQSANTRRRRKLHVVDAFHSRSWQGERVALIDDVLTTGATAEAATQQLLAAGAGEVHLWVAARTLPRC